MWCGMLGCVIVSFAGLECNESTFLRMPAAYDSHFLGNRQTCTPDVKAGAHDKSVDVVVLHKHTCSRLLFG